MKLKGHISEKQRAILHFLRDGEKKKSEIDDQFKGWYFHNHSHYIGIKLHALVKRGYVHRPRHGWYALGSNRAEESDENQLSLF